MKSNCAGKFDIEYCKRVGQGWGVVSVFICHNSIVHANQHRNNDESNQKGWVKVLALFLSRNHIFFGNVFGVTEYSESEEILFVLKFILFFHDSLPIGFMVLYCLNGSMKATIIWLLINHDWNNWRGSYMTLNIGYEGILRLIFWSQMRNFVNKTVCSLVNSIMDQSLLLFNKVHLENLHWNVYTKSDDLCLYPDFCEWVLIVEVIISGPDIVNDSWE